MRLTLAQQILETGTIIQTEISVSQILFVRRKLRSIIYNLVSNAIKYRAADRKPIVLISTKIDHDFLVIAVKDNGTGIAQENLEKVFIKYERIASEVDVTGVGLYLVAEIVRLAGGKITVESEIGVGSTFYVHLKH